MNADKNDVEYHINREERKRDAKLRMKQTQKIIDGDIVLRQFDVVSGPRPRKIDVR